jgi:hypothetical protein
MHLTRSEARVMIDWIDRLPTDNQSLRMAIYNGAIVRLAPTAASRRLVADSTAAIEAELGGDGDIRGAQFRIDDQAFFERVGRLRRLIYTGSHYQQSLRDLVASCGFDPERIAFDPIRLRVVAHRGFENPRAAPIYYAHRDTWYAHPQTLITWWVPLHDLSAEETFVFFPDDFRRIVPNDSERFNYDTWTQEGNDLKIGWQNRDDGMRARYPGLLGDPGPSRPVGFSCRAGEILLFSGAHFHQTLKNTSGRTRFSLDFRTVHLDDQAQGFGAPNVDNRSTGSALRGYIHPDERDSPVAEQAVREHPHQGNGAVSEGPGQRMPG